MGDDAACTDDDIVADGDTRQQNGAAADPDIPMMTGAVWVRQKAKEPSSLGAPNRSAALVG